MEALLEHYTEKITNVEGNIFEVFSKFYNLDLSELEKYLETQFKNKTLKDDKKSTQFRQEGNKCYARKERLKSLEFYTKSLCSATPYGKEYGLALANRSAVSFEMNEYDNCIRDINLCFKTNYPSDLKPKIFIRKAECYIFLGQKQKLYESLKEMYTFITATNIPEKSKYFSKIEHLRKTRISKPTEENRETLHDLPELTNGENNNFAYTSNKIKMNFDKIRGRHVVANENIKKGDVLFVEKAFIFAPVFKETKELYPFKCYNCLKDTISCIPCESCILCVYCNEKCKTSSWSDCHKWECQGMQTNVWYDIGVGFPAFKAMLKGIRSGFYNIKGNYEEDLNNFGNKVDNYPYFNRLVSNIYRSKNVVPYILMAAVVVLYLKKYTDFFTFLLKKPNCPKQDEDSLIRYVGGLITKHTAQLSCNSSTIEHWTYSTSDMLFPDILITVACGMFPSVSIMNHSCRPNVTNFFICDTIVVKALEDIPEKEEIFNCYGIDYRGMNREYRQIACRNIYHFECKCVICSDPCKEVDMLDSYLCPKCKGLVPEDESNKSFCYNCGEKYPLKPFRKINEDAQKYLVDDDQVHQLELLVKCLKVREKILYKHHKDFEEVYYRLYSFYVENGDAENMFKYFHLWLANEKARRGENSRGIGTKLYEAALAILHCLQCGTPKNCTNLNYVSCAKILASVFTASYSHQVAFRPIWHALAKRGHDITLITTDPEKDAPYRQIDTSYSYQIMKKNEIGSLVTKQNLSKIDLISSVLDGLSEIADYQFTHPEVKSLIKNKSEHFDLVMVEVIFPTQMAFKDRFKAPLIGMISLDAPPVIHRAVGNPTHPCLYPEYNLPFTSNLSFKERMISFLFTAVFYYVAEYYIYPREDLTIAKYFDGNIRPLLEIQKEMDFLFLNVNPIFHPIRPLGPNTIQFGGGTHIRKAQPLPKDLQNYLDDSENGVIYFSLGTNVKSNMINDDLRETILQTFADLPYNILWKYEDENLPNKPKNVKILKWIPQQDVFQHKNVILFLTQCGLQSLEEAIFSHLPIAGMPFVGDQLKNSKIIVERGLGLKVDRNNLTKENFKEVLLEVIQNPIYKNNVIEVSKMMQDVEISGLEKAVWYTEYALRWNGAKHLRNTGMDAPFYIYFMLDVVAVVAATLVVILYISYKMLKLFLYMLFGRKRKSKKV